MQGQASDSRNGRPQDVPRVLQHVFGEPNRALFFSDMKSIWEDVKRGKVLDDLLKLQEVSGLWASFAFWVDWSLILLSICSVHYVSIWLLPIALFLTGSRQRGLSNLIHEGS